jgi:hypothetical protein
MSASDAPSPAQAGRIWAIRDLLGQAAPWRIVLRYIAVGLLAGAAAIHAGQVRTHLDEWAPAGRAFIVMGVLEALLALVILLAPSRGSYLAGVWISQATIALWLLSRTVGLPFGPERFTPEDIGRADAIATTLEALTWIVLTALFVRTRPRPKAFRFGHAAIVGTACLVVAAGTWWGMQSSTCDHHQEAEKLTGPLVPVEGHSMLPSDTPVARVPAGEQVGLVVGVLHGCDATFTIERARLVSQVDFNGAVSPVSFWIAPPGIAEPGRPVSAETLARSGASLPADVIPAEDEAEPGPGLVLLVRAVRPGLFIVDGIEVTYTADGRRYRSTYASVAQLEVIAGGSTNSGSVILPGGEGE